METLKYYKSVAELSATLDGDVINANSKKGQGISFYSERRLNEFAGVNSIAEARKLLSFGDADAAAKIRAEGEIIKPQEEHKPVLKTSVVGCLPNVPNYLRGVPCQMYQIKSNSRKKPIINIYVECTIYDGINETELAEKCAVLANTIAAVELTGYRVNLFAICATTNNKNTAGICVNIKEADAPLNLLNVAFPLTNKAFCRAIFLRWIDTNIKQSLKYSFSNYGCVVNSSRAQSLFNADGLFLSMVDLVRQDTTQEKLENIVNKYISEN